MNSTGNRGELCNFGTYRTIEHVGFGKRGNKIVKRSRDSRRMIEENNWFLLGWERLNWMTSPSSFQYLRTQVVIGCCLSLTVGWIVVDYSCVSELTKIWWASWKLTLHIAFQGKFIPPFISCLHTVENSPYTFLCLKKNFHHICTYRWKAMTHLS